MLLNSYPFETNGQLVADLSEGADRDACIFIYWDVCLEPNVNPGFRNTLFVFRSFGRSRVALSGFPEFLVVMRDAAKNTTGVIVLNKKGYFLRVFGMVCVVSL